MPNTPIVLVVLVPSLALLLFAALHDVALRTVPNIVPALLILAGVLLRLASGNLLAGAACMAAVFVATALCWQRGWMGGGDVKLYAACALLVPPGLVMNFILASALAGGALALLYLALRAVSPKRPNGLRPQTFLARLVRAESRRVRRGGPLPYASAIALGAICTLITV